MVHAQGFSGKHRKHWSRQVISAIGMNRIGAHRKNLYAGNIQLRPHVQKEAGSRVREKTQKLRYWLRLLSHSEVDELRPLLLGLQGIH
jgi:hypothetical protein